MSVFFTSDLHFGHANIIGYCHRPFRDVEEMNEQLVDRWNETVGPEGTVWVLGDVALGSIDESLELVGLLNGTKRLVAGNHDRCWHGHKEKRRKGWTERYLAAGFAEIVQGETTIEIAGQEVLMSHFPYEGDSTYEARYLDYRPRDYGRWLLHGHVHDAFAQSGRQINVGVDVRGFRPLGAAAIEALIAAGPCNRGAWDG